MFVGLQYEGRELGLRLTAQPAQELARPGLCEGGSYETLTPDKLLTAFSLSFLHSFLGLHFSLQGISGIVS